jgi:hypothetical protein
MAAWLRVLQIFLRELFRPRRRLDAPRAPTAQSLAAPVEVERKALPTRRRSPPREIAEPRKRAALQIEYAPQRDGELG